MTELRGEGRLVAGDFTYNTANPGINTANRRAVFQVVTPPAEPRITSLGLEIAKTFEVYESEPIEGAVRQYELRIDDELAWTGVGDDRASALLEAILSATGQADELPNQ